MSFEEYVFGYPPRNHVHTIKIPQSSNQCFCTDPQLILDEKFKTGIDIPGKCVPSHSCSNCDVRLNSVCSKDSSYQLLYHQLPYYSIVYPYAKPIYYPQQWHPFSKSK